MSSVSKSLVHLSNRSLLRLAGIETADFLQGLITNDINLLKEGATSLYSLFLNTRGRVLYDTIIYKAQEETFFVECDIKVLSNLVKHLKMYKLRKKVDIQTMENQMNVWTVFDNDVISSKRNTNDKNPDLEGKIFPCGAMDDKSSKLVDNISFFSDPRLSDLGLRILARSDVSGGEISQHLAPNTTALKNIQNYRAFRYQLGIGEGVQDFPPGVPLPLEINCDYLHGVSFHKGCYIGQELTARTHHTGVIRKRLMPLTFDGTSEKPLEYDTKILNDSEKTVGKILGQEGSSGLGLIRIAEALASKTLTAGALDVRVVKPHWWPQESQKVEASAS
ncbi:hypothetical protein QAD02_004236 [Eretmocerus hayati]|uniref:Uncharacterized protein n=1 Tax=Eretmocerus hayati TaxID=131215 RepID=A0ACC2NTV7_9HYME|nr:hypothetical protein QAD02_004236 [Eretmocerus hayati]